MSLVWNPPPQPPQSRLMASMFKGDLQVAAWKQRRGFSGQVHQDPETLDLSENALAYILMEIESRRQKGSRLAEHLHTAMVKFTPQLSQPTVGGGDVEPMAHIFAQPEMLDFWSSWESARSRSARGPKPLDAGAKAVLSTLGMSGHTHCLDAYGDLLEKPELLRVFARVDVAAAALAAQPAPGPLELSTYRGSLKRFDALCEKTSFRDIALATNARLFRGLCELYPDRDFGRGLLIDGCLFPAWCPQKGKGDTEEQEAARRRMTPHAGARLIRYTSSGKQNMAPTDQMSAGAFASSADFDRGYYYVCIIDQASGWPLVSVVMDAALDEAEALTALLSDLYKHFPFIKPQFIAGDGAWDEVWAHRMCELFYGLAPVFRHTERAAATTTLPGGNQSNTVKGFTHDGRLLCMDHGREMPFKGFERASRGSLRPGQGAHGHPDSQEFRRELTVREKEFRVRALHEHGASAQRVSLMASLDWRRLNAFPRHPNGKPELYAERQALGMRLKNQMEGHFNRMQSSLSLMTEDANRLRLQEWDKVEALLHLAELRMNALSLAAERGHMGVGHTLPSDGDVGELPEFPFGRSGPLANRRASTTAVAAATSAATRRARAAAPAPRRHAVPSALVSASTEPEAEPTVVEPVGPVAVPAMEPEHGSTDAPASRPPASPTHAGATVITVDFANRKRTR